MSEALVLFSGGQDSTTTLFWALQEYKGSAVALTINYGQRHRKELEASYTICKMNKIARYDLHVPGVLHAGLSPIIDHDREVERYLNVESLPGGLEKTFVPGRNIFFITIAANLAYVQGINNIIIGVSQEDYGGYPDCRNEFLRHMENALRTGLDKPKLTIRAPLIFKSKKETVEFARQFGENCWEALSYSHTCYNGLCPPCGECHACLLRKKGFQLAGFEDPLIERLKKEGYIK